MEALRETTVWGKGIVSNHTYLLDGSNLVAYIKVGDTAPFYFKNPIKNFDKRGRKFEAVKPNPFKVVKNTTMIEVKGSNGATYTIDPEAKTCSCPGFGFRGKCRHLSALLG